MLGHQGGEKGGEVQAVDLGDGEEDKLEERRTMIEERKSTLKEKKVVLEEKRVKIAANAEDAKMLILNIESLDVGARIFVQFVRYQMLEQ